MPSHFSSVSGNRAHLFLNPRYDSPGSILKAPSSKTGDLCQCFSNSQINPVSASGEVELHAERSSTGGFDGGGLEWRVLKHRMNIGPIRMYILMLDTQCTQCRTNEGCTYVHWRIYSSRDLDTLLYKLELKSEWSHWKIHWFYTITTMEEKCENCS